MFEWLVTRDWDAAPLLTAFATTLQTLALMVVLLVSLAFLLLFDRKVWAAVQMRKGPNVVGAFGLLQSFADFLKFVLKEIVVPAGADKTIFLIAPFVTFLLAFLGWAVVPVGQGLVVADINVGILYLFAVSSLGVYGIIMGGWASNSKYPFLGSLRSAAQMVSYEVSLGFIIISVLLLVGSMNLTDIVNSQARGLGILNWHFIPLFPLFVMFFISALAETNRPPFDLPEAESELVAGYQVEYSSTPYLLFMIGEYLNIVLMCSLLTILFFGGWHSPFPGDFLGFLGPLWFAVKVVFFFFLFAMVKAIVPRYRYDQLMRIGWKIFLPTSIGYLMLVAFVLLYVPGVADLFQGWRPS
ncbi:NADH dehydrogenase subunit H [Parvularcula bermudensis HTCC2503]|uniref:NADH-quinone oxidoreductase subunit H n=1 Tax=Parvularcula bermudensis (strain ATCC BAA-594 / HTCC2503 / KCTC 12087) TaxID=314260 RepID=E0TBU9_PARBH|nr:NADH-quinone oxidoreductase subunit NuoH [Parvularcula bermudensis]ADM08442.1 NADH dehydrogenase subunit H [Parvularcula bermudensis HTCC2503]